MCGISGVIIFKIDNKINNRKKLIERKINIIFTNSIDRGRDSFGIIVIDKNGKHKMKKIIQTPYKIQMKEIVQKNTTIIIANNRAEPTTEYIKNKKSSDVQPFLYDKYMIVHNGTISNDKEINKKFKFHPTTKIDSITIPYLLKYFKWANNLDELKNIFNKNIIGSYATAIINSNFPNELFLINNYKPIFIHYDKELECIFFASLKQYLGDLRLEHIEQLNPYTATKITTDNQIKTINIRKYTPTRKVLVVCSGGLDSVTVATKLIKDGYKITLLHFLYKCRAEEKEKEAIIKVANKLKCEYIFADTQLFKTIIGGSRLTETSTKINKERAGERGAELAYEWVPARNLIMLSIATGIAESKGYGYIALGNNLEESGAYPDNEMIFIEKFKEILPYSINLNKEVKVIMPVGNLMKHEIVKLGIELDAPLECTWSCYERGNKHCGRCGPCYMRRKAFEMNNKKDVVEYENE